jgi:hypothetical protein
VADACTIRADRQHADRPVLSAWPERHDARYGRRGSCSPQFYSIQAQLQGGGIVHCKLLVDGKALSHSTANGGYEITQCEISKNPLIGKRESVIG